MDIYAFSGLGADKRVYNFLGFSHNLITIDWIDPQKNEDIESYSKRISAQIPTDKPFGIIGVSFGGLIAMEVSKLLHPSFTILISSVQNKNQLPFIYRLTGKLKLPYFFPAAMFRMPPRFAHYLFKAKNKQLLSDIIKDTSPIFTKWAICQLTRWKNTVAVENCYIISGNKDLLLPPPPIQEVKIIPQGGHFMIVDKADEVSKHINLIIKKLIQ